MSTTARKTYESAITSAGSTKLASLDAANQTRVAAYHTALAAFNAGGSYATYAAAIVAADKAYLAAVDAAEAAREQSVASAAATLVASDAVGPSGFGLN
ncbi:MAG TPA: hypothetical protein VGU20_01110 [Stellaceae bacterium]|nr:hypothetical protein [Stellaceae bacterium]